MWRTYIYTEQKREKTFTDIWKRWSNQPPQTPSGWSLVSSAILAGFCSQKVWGSAGTPRCKLWTAPRRSGSPYPLHRPSEGSRRPIAIWRYRGRDSAPPDGCRGRYVARPRSHSDPGSRSRPRQHIQAPAVAGRCTVRV